MAVEQQLCGNGLLNKCLAIAVATAGVNSLTCIRTLSFVYKLCSYGEVTGFDNAWLPNLLSFYTVFMENFLGIVDLKRLFQLCL